MLDVMGSLTSSLLSRRRLVWAVPAVTAAAIAGAVLVPLNSSATVHPKLPPRTAAQLLAAVQGSSGTALSGTVVETARLGLPSLPTADASASLDWQSLIVGSHSARVWVDGQDRQRVGLLGTLSEAEVIHNGRDVWTYTSRTNQVTHQTLSPDATGTDHPDATDKYTPQGAADAALKAIDPTTRVSVDDTQKVAGRSAYVITLTPKDARSTVERVTIALDSVHYVPLRVQVFGSAARPAIEVGFTDVTFARPEASLFRFRAPAGATTTNDPLGVGRDGERNSTPEQAAPSSVVIGSGWTTIVELPSGAAGAQMPGLLDKLTKVQPDGSRRLTTSLVNALLTKDGRVFVGAVSPAALAQAAQTHR